MNVQKLLTSPASVRDAPISIEEMYSVHKFVTVAQLVDWVMSHLSNSIQAQVLTLIGSVDALGNPAALFRHFSTGIRGVATGLLDADPMKAGSERILIRVILHSFLQ